MLLFKEQTNFFSLFKKKKKKSKLANSGRMYPVIPSHPSVSGHVIPELPSMQCVSVSHPSRSDPILCLLIGPHWSELMANPSPLWYNQANDGRLARYFPDFLLCSWNDGSGCPFNDLASTLLPLVFSLFSLTTSPFIHSLSFRVLLSLFSCSFTSSPVEKPPFSLKVTHIPLNVLFFLVCLSLLVSFSDLPKHSFCFSPLSPTFGLSLLGFTQV